MTGVPTTDRPWLVADIGGTNARFGLVTAPAAPPCRVTVLRCGDHPDLASAVQTYLDAVDDLARPRVACVAVAGPVTGDRFRLTNAAWDFSVRETGHRLSLTRLELVNDLTALALAVPQLSESELWPIGGLRRLPGRPLAVIAPGTGLGVAGLVPTPGDWAPLPGEGGHVTIPVETDLESEVDAALRARQVPRSAESLLSGPGLVRLYECLAQINGVEAQPMTPEEVARRGAERADLLCVQAVRLFCGLLGAFAGNVALTLGARGGVILGGGVLPSLAGVLERSDFRRRFENKPPMTGYLRDIPTELVVAATPALLGAASWLQRQQATQEAA